MEKQLSASDNYRVISRYYDFFVSRPLSRLRKEVCRIAVENGRLNIVDICCGTGEQCIMLNHRGLTVTGIDNSPAMLSVADKKSPPEIDYMRADAANLPVADNVFDCAILSFSIHEMIPENRAAVMSEAERVLQPGGLLIVVDYIPADSILSKLFSGLIRLVEWLAGKDHYRNYRQWMSVGALPAFLAGRNLQTSEKGRFLLRNVAVIAARTEQVSSP